MFDWRTPAAVLCRIGSFVVGVGGLLWALASRPADLGSRTGSGVRFAFTLLGAVAGFVVLQVAGVLLELRGATDEQVLRAEGEAAKPKPETLALGLGAVLVLAVAVPQFFHIAAVVPYQTVTACRTGFGPRWHAEVDLSGGGSVSIGHFLDPGDACIPAGTSFEKRRWEAWYRVGGEPLQAKASYQQGMQLGVMLGFGLVVVGVGLRTLRRRYR